MLVLKLLEKKQDEIEIPDVHDAWANFGHSYAVALEAWVVDMAAVTRDLYLVQNNYHDAWWA